MAGTVNKVILIGYLGRDPDVRSTQGGKPVTTFSVATSETWRDKTSGERKEKTEWHRVVIFNEGLAKLAGEGLKKGSHVYLEGQLATRKWTDQAGVEKYTTEVVLQNFSSNMTFLDKREGGPPPAGSPDDYGSTRSSGAPGASDAKPNDMDDEIPF